MDITGMIEYLRGRSSKGYELFGAQFVQQDMGQQLRFTVYAPNAKEVALIGDFNGWQPWPMQRLDCGIWWLTSPDPKEMGTECLFPIPAEIEDDEINTVMLYIFTND